MASDTMKLLVTVLSGAVRRITHSNDPFPSNVSKDMTSVADARRPLRLV